MCCMLQLVVCMAVWFRVCCKRLPGPGKINSLALDFDSLGLRSTPGILAKSLRGTRTPNWEGDRGKEE